MKIIIALNYLNKHGGVERMVSNLASELSSYGDYSVEVLSFFKENKDTIYPISEKVSIRYILPHTSYKNKFFRRKKIVQEIRNIVKENNNELVMISTSASITLLLFIFSFWKKDKKIIAWEHSLLFEQGFYSKLIHRTIYNHIDCIVTINSLDFEYMKKINKKTELIENFISPHKIMKSSLSNPKIISVGRLEYEKGFDNLIYAMREIHNIYPKWTLHIYGDGSQKALLNRLIIDLGLSNTVLLHGFVDNIEEKYFEASIYVLSSRSEAFPLTLIEAINSGLIVIAPNISESLVENAKKARNHYIYEKNNLDDLIEKINDSINDLLSKDLSKIQPKKLNKSMHPINKWLEIIK